MVEPNDAEQATLAGVPAAASDWHPADIYAALRKRGYNLAALSVDSGYHRTAVGKALRRHWPAAEKIIADAIGVPPQTIWPSRYRTPGH